MSEFECPFCHHHHTNFASLLALKTIRAKGIRKRILDILIGAYPGGLTMETIFADIYGKSLGTEAVIAVVISGLRNNLAAYGWTIPHYVTGGNRYRLVPVEQLREAA